MPAAVVPVEPDPREVTGDTFIQYRLLALDCRAVVLFGVLPIPTKPPVFNGMIAPRDSWMMPPPCNEMIPPGAPRLLA